MPGNVPQGCPWPGSYAAYILCYTVTGKQVMSPTIRIDDEVWAWLKQLAEPFEDTPNGVLRRVAKLDLESGEHSPVPNDLKKAEPTDPQGAAVRTDSASRDYPLGRRITGYQLNRQYHLGTK